MNYCLTLVLAAELCSLSHSVSALQMANVKTPEVAHRAVQADTEALQTISLLKDPSRWVIACSRNQKIFLASATATMLVSLMVYYRKHGMAKMLNFLDWIRNNQLTQLQLDHEFYTAIADNIFDGLKGAEMWWLRGADVNGHMNGDHPLHRAAYNGNEKIVRWLVNHKADIDHPDNTGQTPAMRTAANPTEHTRDIIYFLKNKGAEFNAVDNRGENVLAKAVLQPNLYTERFVDDLITKENINVQDIAYETALMKTLAIPDPSKVINKELLTRLAINLIHKNADIHLLDATGETVLHRAVKFGYGEVAKSLLNNFGSQKEGIAELEKALKLAVEYGKYELIEPIKQELYGQTGGKDYESKILSWAITMTDPNFSLTILEELLGRRKKFLTSQILNGALIEAIYARREAHVTKLLQAGAAIDTENNEGCTPLMQAIILEATDIALALLRRPIVAESMRHGVALQIQTSKNNVIQLQSQPFLDMINHQDRQGYTALHYAIEHNNFAIVGELLKVGADKNLVTKVTKQTPRDVAKSNGFHDLETLFIPQEATNSYHYNNNVSFYAGWGH